MEVKDARKMVQNDVEVAARVPDTRRRPIDAAESRAARDVGARVDLDAPRKPLVVPGAGAARARPTIRGVPGGREKVRADRT